MRTAVQKERSYHNSATMNLINIMNLRLTGIEDVVRTSDGHYIGRDPGDIGFNHYIGQPAPVHDGPGRQRSTHVFNGLKPREQEAVRRRAAYPVDGEPIPLNDFVEGGEIE